jgi:hypothetical protein
VLFEWVQRVTDAQVRSDAGVNHLANRRLPIYMVSAVSNWPSAREQAQRFGAEILLGHAGVRADCTPHQMGAELAVVSSDTGTQLLDEHAARGRAAGVRAGDDAPDRAAPAPALPLARLA